MAKIKGVMNLIIQKIQMKECGDWFSPELTNIEPGLYLVENPDGTMFFMNRRNDGYSEGMYLPIQEIGKIYAEEAEQKVFERIKPILEKGFGDIGSRLKSIETTTNNSDCILNDMMVGDAIVDRIAKLNNGVDSLKKDIEQLYKNIENFQNNIGNHKPSMAEMSDAVVNIIKAAK